MLALLAAAAAAEDQTPLNFERIDLLDGRILHHVVLKTYDADTGNVLLVADRTATVVPVRLFPGPFAERFKKILPKAGASTAVVAARPGATVSPATAVRAVPLPTPLAVGSASSAIAAHRAAAEARARRYFEYEFKAGSDAIVVTSLHIETDRPRSVEGWPGQYRTEGRAFLEFYDSKGHSFSRTSRRFEVRTERKPGEEIKVIGFTCK